MPSLVGLDLRLLHVYLETILGGCNHGVDLVSRYGGWESPEYQWGLLNGHFTGHLLSALAFDAAGTEASSVVTAAKSDSLIAELAKCQSAIAKAHPERAGWLSAYSISQMDRLDAHNT